VESIDLLSALRCQSNVLLCLNLKFSKLNQISLLLLLLMLLFGKLVPKMANQKSAFVLFARG